MSVFCEAAERQNEIIKNKTMTRKAHELVFVSQIERDGSGTKPVKESYIKDMLENPLMKDNDFKINVLSLSEETYIAFNFNAFVVKLKI
jgi:hypothetical protein